VLHKPPIHICNDRAVLESLPEDVQTSLVRKGLITSSGKKVSFCGLIQTSLGTHIFLPRKMKPEAQFIPDVFSALRKYTMQSSSLIQNDDEGENLIGSASLTLIKELLSDYRSNGLYSRRNRIIRVNTGKPNWSRTINRFSPFLTQKGPVYLDYIGTSSRNQVDSEVSRIHAYIVRYLDTSYAEIFFGAISYQDDGLPPPKSLDKIYIISVLNSELQKLYSERDIRLFKFLIKYMEDVHGHNTSNIVIGIRGFHTLWEYMLKATILGAVDINKEFSIPTYIDSNGKHLKAPKKGQRTDLIVHCKLNDIYAVVDAKYYDATNLNSAPGWGDLLKQFFYAKAISSLQPLSKVKNYFIFPGEQQHFKSAYMSKRSNEQPDTQYNGIECLYVDPYAVIKAYVESSSLDDLSRQLVKPADMRGQVR
jgi:hypothetical protein